MKKLLTPEVTQALKEAISNFGLFVKASHDYPSTNAYTLYIFSQEGDKSLFLFRLNVDVSFCITGKYITEVSVTSGHLSYNRIIDVSLEFEKVLNKALLKR